MNANLTSTVLPPSRGPDAVRARPKPKRNYLLRPDYRETSLHQVFARSESKTIAWLAQIRWGVHGKDRQVCPTCGTIDKHYWCKSVARWKCRSKLCGKQFSVFSGTRMHSTKLSAKEFVSLMLHFVEAKDSQSAREQSGLHGRDHQTVHVALLKVRDALRESLMAEPPLEGYIQADAAYFIKYVRPGNVGTGASLAARASRKNAGLDENAKETKTTSANMHALVVFVQAGPQGMRRYKVAVIKTENQVDLLKLGQRYCAQSACLITDQHSAYNFFSGEFDEHLKVNHTKEFVSEDGVHTNFAESFFARMRAATWGAWHRTSIQHLEEYGWEMAWRQTMVGRSNLEQLEDLLARVLSCGRSERYRDYWNKLPPEKRQAKGEIGSLVEIPKEQVSRKRGRPAQDAVLPKAPARRGSYRAPRGSAA